MSTLIQKGYPIISLSDLAGTLASFAVRQSPYDCPDNLQQVIERFCTLARPEFEQIDQQCFFRTFESQRELEDFIRQFLPQLPDLEAWNEPKSGHDCQFVCVSRYGGPSPDDDIIDLDALMANVAGAAFAEAQEHREQHLQEQRDMGEPGAEESWQPSAPEPDED